MAGRAHAPENSSERGRARQKMNCQLGNKQGTFKWTQVLRREQNRVLNSALTKEVIDDGVALCLGSLSGTLPPHIPPQKKDGS